MVLRTVILTSLLAASALCGMDRLPADIIRIIGKKVARSDWTDTHRAFGLQSLATLNQHWNTAMTGLTRADFPYQCQQAAAEIMVG